MSLGSIGFRRLVFSLAVLVASGQMASAQETFEYRAKPGDKHIYRTSVTSNNSQKVAGQDIATEFKISTIAERVFKEPDENGNLQFRVDNKLVKVEATVPGLGKYTFDSAKEENESGSQLGDSLAPYFGAVAGMSYDVSISKLGKVAKVEGMSEALKDVLKGNPIAQQFAGGGSNEVAKAGTEDQFIRFKKEGVNPGDEWEVDIEIEMPKLGKANGKRRIRFDGDDKVGDTPTKKFTVTVEVKFDLDLDSGGAKVTGTIESESSSGTYHFDPAVGQIISGNMKQTLSGTLTASVGGNDVVVETSQTQNVKLERLSELPKTTDETSAEKTESDDK